MLKNVLIGVLLVATVLLAIAVIRLESYHYSSEASMCSQAYARDPIARLARHKCLHNAGARNPLEHLLHGVMPD